MNLCQTLATMLANERDTSGVYGGILHYVLIFVIVGSTLLVFLYFWRKGRLDMDEEPKLEMMRNKEEWDGS